MGIRDIFKKKDNRNNYSFNEEDRVQSAEVRKLNSERKQILQKIEIEKAKLELADIKAQFEELNGIDEEENNINSPENMLMSLITNALLKGNVQQPPVLNNENSPLFVELSQEDVKNIYNQIPKQYLKQAKKMTDSELITFGKMNYPQLKENQIKQLIEYIRFNDK